MYRNIPALSVATSLPSAPAHSKQWHATLWILLCAAAMLLGGCGVVPTTTPAKPSVPVASSNPTPMVFNVENIRTVNSYSAPLRPPYIEHMLTPSMAERIRHWAQTNLQASGEMYQLEVTVLDAHIKEVPLKRDTGILGIFKKEPSYTT